MSAVAFKMIENGVWRVIVADNEAWDALPHATPLEPARSVKLHMTVKADGGVHFHSDEPNFVLRPGDVYECFKK